MSNGKEVANIDISLARKMWYANPVQIQSQNRKPVVLKKWFQPGKDGVRKDSQPLRSTEYVSHADGRRHKKQLQKIELSQICSLEDAHKREYRQKSNA